MCVISRSECLSKLHQNIYSWLLGFWHVSDIKANAVPVPICPCGSGSGRLCFRAAVYWVCTEAARGRNAEQTPVRSCCLLSSITRVQFRRAHKLPSTRWHHLPLSFGTEDAAGALLCVCQSAASLSPGLGLSPSLLSLGASVAKLVCLLELNQDIQSIFIPFHRVYTSIY